MREARFSDSRPDSPGSSRKSLIMLYRTAEHAYSREDPLSASGRHGMELILRRYGNSTVVVLPPAVLKELGLSAGQAMTLATTARGEIVLARKRKFLLADLISQCDPSAPPPADLALWDTAKSVGQEVW